MKRNSRERRIDGGTAAGRNTGDNHGANRWLARFTSAWLVLALALTGPATAHAEVETITWLVTDHLDNPILARDANQNTVWREDYSPWGERLTASPANPADLGFTGHYEEADLGLVYAGARWYDPDIGRFLSPDPVGYLEGGPQHFNRYAYANNNPVIYVDPDGRAVDTIWDGLNVAMGVASLRQNLAAGDYSSAAVDGLGIVADGAAMAFPFVPGGAGTAIKAARGVAKEIPISRAKYGEAADHIADAQKAGHPDVLTVARDGASANRNASIGGLPKVLGKQLDEYPPAMFSEGGAGASVRAINPRDNMAAGACIGNACRGLTNGEKVRIKVVD